MSITKPTLADKSICTGCGACALKCPKGNIEMVYDDEGFLFPQINKNCIGCNLCEKVCPIINKSKLDIYEQIACGAIHRDKMIWGNSSSGGAFSAICKLYGDSQTVVFGAAFDCTSKKIKHISVNGVENIAPLLGSKYVQSELGDSFIKVKEFLNNGSRVIFSGTPCQIAGLKVFLRDTKIDNLLCIDLVCHGVGSPELFSKYLQALEIQYKKKIKNFNFRYKRMKFGIHSLYNVKITFEDESTLIDTSNLFINLFLQKMICRKSCDNCLYTCSKREGDITVADFKNMYSVIKDAPYNRNGSAIICNSEKGKEIFSKLENEMMIFECSTESIIRGNNPLSRCIQSPALRESFFEYYKKNISVLDVMQKFRRREKFISRITALIPTKVKANIKKGWEKQ